MVPKNNTFHQLYPFTTFRVIFYHPSGLTEWRLRAGLIHHCAISKDNTHCSHSRASTPFLTSHGILHSLVIISKHLEAGGGCGRELVALGLNPNVSFFIEWEKYILWDGFWPNNYTILSKLHTFSDYSISSISSMMLSSWCFLTASTKICRPSPSMTEVKFMSDSPILWSVTRSCSKGGCQNWRID